MGKTNFFFSNTFLIFLREQQFFFAFIINNIYETFLGVRKKKQGAEKSNQ